MKTIRFAGLALLCLLFTTDLVAQEKARKVLESNDKPDVMIDSLRLVNTDYERMVAYSLLNDHDVHLFPDSVRIEFPDLEARIVVTLRSIGEAEDFVPLERYIKFGIKTFEASVADLSVPHIMSISFKKNFDKIIEISETEKGVTKIITRRDSIIEMLPPGWEINMKGNHANIMVYARTFEQLKKLSEYNFSEVTDKVKADLANDKPNRNYLASIVIRNGQIEKVDAFHRRVLDLLEMKVGTGIGLVNNTFYPMLNASVNLTFSDRYNVGRHRLTVNTTNMLFTAKRSDGSLKTNLQKFVNLSYNLNLSNSNEDPVFVGLGAGYKLGNDGGGFQGNTMRVFANSTFGRFTVSPELFITNGFKDAIGGISLGISF